MIDLATDPDYSRAYAESFTPGAQDSAPSPLSDQSEITAHADSLTVRVSLRQRSVRRVRDLYVADADWAVTTAVRAEGEEAYRSPDAGGWYQSVEARLRWHRVCSCWLFE